MIFKEAELDIDPEAGGEHVFRNLSDVFPSERERERELI